MIHRSTRRDSSVTTAAAGLNLKVSGSICASIMLKASPGFMPSRARISPALRRRDAGTRARNSLVVSVAMLKSAGICSASQRGGRTGAEWVISSAPRLRMQGRGQALPHPQSGRLPFIPPSRCPGNPPALIQASQRRPVRENGGRMHPACGIDPHAVSRLRPACYRRAGTTAPATEPPPPDMAPRTKPHHAAPRFAVFSARHAGPKRLSHSGIFHRIMPCAPHAQSPRMWTPQMALLRLARQRGDCIAEDFIENVNARGMQPKHGMLKCDT